MKMRGIFIATAIVLATTGYAAAPVRIAGSGANVGAVRAAIAGSLHLALASRTLTEAERGAAYDPSVADACLRLFREKGCTIGA